MKTNKLILILFIFVASSAFVFAQDDNSVQPGYFIDYSEGHPRIMQRFVWKAEEYASRYELFVQLYDYGYREYLIETTTDNFIDVSLPPGKYRYSVTPFDVLGRPIDASHSEWKEITVIEALQPHVERFSPAVFFLDQKLDRVLTVLGTNISEESEIFLESDNIFYPVDMHPVSIDFNNGRAALHFNDLTLMPGKYNIYIKNPGGLDTRSGPFNITYRKPFYIFTKLFYYPVIPVYGALEHSFGARVYPGFSFNLELISSKRSTFNGGFALAVSGYFFNPALTFKDSFQSFLEGFKQTGDGIALLDISINIALQKSFLDGRLAFTFRFGYGLTDFRTYGSYGDEELTGNLNLGSTLLYRLYDVFYLEAGADYTHFMTSQTSGVIKPKIGIVWRY
jgi:hypothetical protein